jgi:hypothetical protein
MYIKAEARVAAGDLTGAALAVKSTYSLFNKYKLASVC